MAQITILGAGYMGSALTFPATDNGHRVALWGTWLDDHLVAAVQRGEPHPKLRMRLPANVRVYPHTELAQALQGAELIVNALTSDGTLPVLSRAASGPRDSGGERVERVAPPPDGPGGHDVGNCGGTVAATSAPAFPPGGGGRPAAWPESCSRRPTT